MLASSYPVNFPIPFANSAGVGYIRAIPQASQIGITAGAASLTDGFPPLNFLPTTSGGVPPFGQDMNGILNEITANIQWEQAGGQPIYNASFSTAIGGYPNGAVLQSADGTGFWRSTVDNNTSNPETGGANWVPHFFYGSASIPLTNADVTLTLAQSAKPVLILTGAITANLNLILPTTINKWIIQNNTTGAFTITAKTPAGTGVSATQSAATYVYGDGTNIYSAGGITQSAADARYVLTTLAPSIQGAFKNLQLSATGTNATVTVTADEITLETSANLYKTLRGVSLSINSAGSGQGGLDTGTIAASTWYSVWVIWNGTAAAGLISLSATAPTLQTGYTYSARVGWIRTDGTANKYPLSFQQKGRRARYKTAAASNLLTLPIMISGSSGVPTDPPTWTAVATGIFIPPTASFIDVLMFNGGGSTESTIAAPNNAYGGYGSTTNPPPFLMRNGTGGFPATLQGSMELESTNVYYASNSTTASNLTCMGWEDNI